jgi:hypothetical protein
MMRWSMGEAVCEMVMHFTVLLMGSSLWHTGLISVHRLIVVVFNNFYKKVRELDCGQRMYHTSKEYAVAQVFCEELWNLLLRLYKTTSQFD